MTHLAMWEGPGDGQGPETEWGALVADAEYSAGVGPAPVGRESG